MNLKTIAYRASQLGLAILLIVSPILLGGNRHVFELVNLAMTLVIMCLFIYSGNMAKLLAVLSRNTRNLLIFMFFVIPLWLVFQASLLTPEILHHPLGQTLGLDGAGSISLNSGLTWSSLLAYLSLSVIFIGIYMAIYDIKAAVKLQFLCLMVINFVALFGLIVVLFDLKTLGIVDKIDYNGWVTGTYVYKNAMANFVGFGLVICAAYLIELLVNKRGWTQKMSLSTQVFLFLINFVFLTIILVLTGSRGGVISVFVAIILVLILVFVARRKLMKRQKTFGLSVLAFVAGLVVLIVVAFYYLAEGRGDLGAVASVQDRFNLILDAIVAINDRSVLGHGVGAYIDLEPLYHNLNMNDGMLWNKLHATHIELMVTIGLPIFIIIYYFVFGILAHLVKRSLKSSVNWLFTLPAMAIIIEMLIHAAVDFTLQIPTIGLYAVVLISFSFNQKLKINHDAEAAPLVNDLLERRYNV